MKIILQTWTYNFEILEVLLVIGKVFPAISNFSLKKLLTYCKIVSQHSWTNEQPDQLNIT